MAALASAGLLLISIVSCASAPTPAPSSATPTPTPVFASDEEALAAATEAYANYLSVYDEYWAGGEVSKAEFLDLSTGAAHAGEVKSMNDWETKGWKAVGSTSFDSIELQSVSQTTSGRWAIRAYLCADASEGDVVDQNGVSMAKPDRILRLPLEIEFQTTSSDSNDLKISESNVWSGANFC